MRYVEAGGVRLSAVGLGTWQFGSGEWAYGPSYAEETAPALVRRALELGITLIDTAEAYAFGRSERIVGRALGQQRDQAFVATKLFPILPVDPVVGRRARGSLRRLGTDVLDLYQVHWPNPLVPSGPTMAAMGKLQREGLVRHVGVSNYSAEQWAGAEAALGGPVLSNQVQFNLVDRRPEQAIVPWAQANDRLVIAYSPVAQGLLSGRYGPGRPPKGLRSVTGPFLQENLARSADLLETLRGVASAQGATPAQVALAWLLAKPNVVVIPGASSVDQLEANAAAADLELTPGQLEDLDRASAAYHPLTGAAAAKAMAAARADRLVGRFRRTAEGLRA
jgi:aryl-alcohol dehydrogenase-like predicted oxidoreductase